MSDSSSGAETPQEHLANQIEQLERMTAAATELQHRVESLRVSRWSPGHEVEVSVGSTGLLDGIEFTSRAMALPAGALSALILTTLRSALAELQAKVEALAEEAGPSLTATNYLSSYRAAFAEPLAKLAGDPGAESGR